MDIYCYGMIPFAAVGFVGIVALLVFVWDTCYHVVRSALKFFSKDHWYIREDYSELSAKVQANGLSINHLKDQYAELRYKLIELETRAKVGGAEAP